MVVALKRTLALECVPNTLSMDRSYLVLGISANHYRLLDDRGEPVIFDPELFDILDETQPNDWVTEYGESGERYSRPIGMDRHAWESYHDDAPWAVETVKRYLAKIGPCSWPND